MTRVSALGGPTYSSATKKISNVTPRGGDAYAGSWERGGRKGILGRMCKRLEAGDRKVLELQVLLVAQCRTGENRGTDARKAHGAGIGRRETSLRDLGCSCQPLISM